MAESLSGRHVRCSVCFPSLPLAVLLHQVLTFNQSQFFLFRSLLFFQRHNLHFLHHLARFGFSQFFFTIHPPSLSCCSFLFFSIPRSLSYSFQPPFFLEIDCLIWPDASGARFLAQG
ncbi:hypothetical protein CHARACLAT_010825 [Characodon lateralis]|uniref:Uncharacterized protein n=1 Tax=Characodon lateralis TaxID=208331 RepID=A0ABU7DQ37_9TELE|nr:hypothetical protein [Characodon lateralis]